MNYAALAKTALKLLKDFGGKVTHRTYTTGTYDPATGLSGASSVDSTPTGVLLDFGSGQTLERGTLIQGGDKRLLLEPSASVSPQDHFIVNGTEYLIVSIGEVKPAATRVLYDIHLKT